MLPRADGSCPAIVYAEATLLPTVNRITLAAANTGGTWQPPSYALGNAKGEAWLIIDKCVDVALTGQAAGTSVLIPNAELFAAIHWADTPEMAHLRTEEPAHNHGGQGQSTTSP